MAGQSLAHPTIAGHAQAGADTSEYNRKVAILLEELGLTYESIYLDFGKNEQKQPPHINYNPNGRIPTIIDHKNGDFVLWESDAILLYLVDKYDTEKRFTVTDENEKHLINQWLFFQASGQGCVSAHRDQYDMSC